MFAPELKPFQIYFTLFFLFGLNPFVSFANEQKRQSKLLIVIPRLVAVLCNISIAYRECKNFPLDTVATIFGRLVLVSGAVVNLIAIFENLFHAHLVYQIFSEISAVINILRICLNINYSHKLMKKSLNRRLTIHIVIIVLGSTIKFYVETTNGIECTLSVLWTISNVIEYMHLFHLSFYIEFIRFILKSLSEKLADKMINCQTYWYHGQNNELWHSLHHMKSVYLKLWNVSQKVNALFGWFLVICMLETTSTAVFNAYWEYDLLTHAAARKLARKYHFHFILASYKQGAKCLVKKLCENVRVVIWSLLPYIS